VTRVADAQHLAVVVHEVRSPVAALAGIAQALSGAGAGGPARLELTRLAVTACHAIERIVVDTVTTSVRREPVDAAAIVRDAAAAAALGGAQVETRVARDLPRIHGDPLRLRQALDNLVENALVHSRSEAPVVVGAAASMGFVSLYVSDSGVGIPESDRERILEAGVRLHVDTPGSGLGLSLVRAVAEAHGGRLVVTSTPGGGATFTLELPAH
jgi:signal transduction histidine kinase